MTINLLMLCLLGPARSGTKLVRDLLAKNSEIDKVPYDVNYIWRLGNEDLSHDELTPGLLSPDIKNRIIKNLGKYHQNGHFLIEKTVSNCLRIPFVRAVFPDAKFIYLYRDGYDVIESAYRQWMAPLDPGYIFKKALTFPITDAFGYALSYARSSIGKLISQDRGRVGSWGPRYRGIDEDLETKDILEVCAIQWSVSVMKALQGFSSVPPDCVISVSYEEFVRAPKKYLFLIAKFIGIEPTFFIDTIDVSHVSQRNIGKGTLNLTAEQIGIIQPYIKSTRTI